MPRSTGAGRSSSTPSDSGCPILVEPIAQVIGAPYGGNPPDIPNEDSTDFQLDETDIFSFDRLPGYDLVETGPRANVGFRARGADLSVRIGRTSRRAEITG